MRVIWHKGDGGHGAGVGDETIVESTDDGVPERIPSMLSEHISRDEGEKGQGGNPEGGALFQVLETFSTWATDPVQWVLPERSAVFLLCHSAVVPSSNNTIYPIFRQ